MPRRPSCRPEGLVLPGATALVTGAAVRLGRELARALASRGCRLGLHYHSSRQEAERLQRELAREGVEAGCFQADLTDPSACRGLVQAVEGAFSSPVQILVNSAAEFLSGGLDETTIDDWDRQLRLNLRAPFLLSQELVRRLPADQSAVIVNVVDARLRQPSGDHLAYRVSKAGLAHLGESLARALAPRVRVNAIAPGALLPPPGESAAQMRQRLGDEIPLGPIGDGSFAGAALDYLLSQPFLTGQTIYLDGGQYL